MRAGQRISSVCYGSFGQRECRGKGCRLSPCSLSAADLPGPGRLEWYSKMKTLIFQEGIIPGVHTFTAYFHLRARKRRDTHHFGRSSIEVLLGKTIRWVTFQQGHQPANRRTSSQKRFEGPSMSSRCGLRSFAFFIESLELLGLTSRLSASFWLCSGNDGLEDTLPLSSSPGKHESC